MRRTGRGRLVLAALACAALGPGLPVALLRFVPPVATPFMLARYAPFARGDAACREIAYEWVPAEEVAHAVFLAVVAAEDQRFLAHRGFDYTAIRDALEERAERGRLRGASTISQQVAKNLFLWPGRSWVRKLLEAPLTVWIEALWPKRRILEVYVNVAQFGPCTFGVEAAARRYFHTTAARLSPAQAARLAAVLPDPFGRRAGAPSPAVAERAARIEAEMRQLAGSEWIPALGVSH